jgi:MFS family permease
VPFALDAVSYAVNWVLLGRLRTDLSRPPRDPAESHPGFVEDIRSGMRFTLQHDVLRMLCAIAPLINLTINALFFAAEIRLIRAGFPAWSIGLVSTAIGAAGILGALAAPWLIGRFPTGPLLVASVWAFVPGLVLIAFWNNPVAVAVGGSVGIFLNPAGNAGIFAYAQSLIPEDMLGRFMAALTFLVMSLHWAAPLVGGLLLAFLPGREAMLVLALLVGLVALLPTASRTIMGVGRPSSWQPTPQPAE